MSIHNISSCSYVKWFTFQMLIWHFMYIQTQKCTHAKIRREVWILRSCCHGSIQTPLFLLLNHCTYSLFYELTCSQIQQKKHPTLLKVTRAPQCQHNANHLSLCQYSQYCTSNMERGIRHLMHVNLFAVVWLSQ